MVYCGQTVGWIKMKVGMKVGLGPDPFVLDGEPDPLPKRVRSPTFSAHICCGQMIQCMKMPLGRDIALSPSDIVLDGDPAAPPSKWGGAPPP